MTLPFSIGARSATPGFLRRRSFARRREFHSCPARLGESDGDGLFRIARSMFTLADIVNFLADEFAGLRARRLPLSFVSSRFSGCFFLWHTAPLLKSALIIKIK